MNLADQRLARLDDRSLTADEQALLRCRSAAELIFVGQYEDARVILGRLWRGVGARPPLDGLGARAAAEVLTQCGALSGWVGSSQHLAGAQEDAKNLLSEALRIFETLGPPAKVSEARYELSICYWRLGALDEARVLLAQAQEEFAGKDLELKAKILIRRTLVEISAHRYHEAWDILKEAEPVFSTASDALKGRWHSQKALVLNQLAAAEGRADYSDAAIIEFTAAIYHFEMAAHERFCGASLNNLAFLLYKLGRYDEAHEHLDRAREIFTRLEDPGNAAQVNETRARVLVAEGRFAEARGVIAVAVAALREGEEYALLADALVVEGVALARLGEHEQSVASLREAMTTGEYAGALESAGHAALALVEEHGAARLTEDELYETYGRADALLARTQDAEDVARLRACARIVTGRLAGASLPEGFSLPRAVRDYEARFVARALAQEGGSVSRAARRLGVKHQTLAHLLRGRHAALGHARTPPVPRRSSIIRLRHAAGGASYAARADVRRVAILHVEDNDLVADAVKDTLEMEGWRVEVCADGAEALRRLEGDAHFDLLIVDYDLPDMDGLALTRRARQFPHRMRVPVVMFSATDYSGEARAARVDAFLKKPEGLNSLIDTITRLVADVR